MSARLRFLARSVAAVASGLLLTLAFPDPGWWPLAPAAVAGLTLAARGASARAAALLGFVFGVAFFAVHLSWSGTYVGVVPWAALTTVESLYLVPMAALLPRCWRLGRGIGVRAAAMAVSVGGLWVAQEALRGRWPFGGFPWARLAASQSAAPDAGLAALGGLPLVSWAVAACGGLLALAVAELVRRPARVTAVLPLAAALLVPCTGLLVPLPTAGQAGRSGSSVQVSAVQGDVPQAGLEFNAQRRAVLDNHANATLQLAAEVRAGRTPQPDLVLWPENSSDIDPLRNPDAYDVIDGAAGAIRAPILVGAVLDDGSVLRNAAIVWSPNDLAAGARGPVAQVGPGATYVKQHPVPFAEYIPDRAFFRHFSDKVDLVPEDFVAGHRSGVLQVGPARVGDVICFEVAYDGLVRTAVRRGADLLVVQTNNATFGYTDESVQQLAMSRLRAIESGRAVVHVSTVGVSAIIEPDGRIVRSSGLFTRDVLSARVPLRHSQTVATRLGVLPEAVLAVLGLLVLAFAGLATPAGGRRRAREGVA